MIDDEMRGDEMRSCVCSAAVCVTACGREGGQCRGDPEPQKYKNASNVKCGMHVCTNGREEKFGRKRIKVETPPPPEHHGGEEGV